MKYPQEHCPILVPYKSKPYPEAEHFSLHSPLLGASTPPALAMTQASSQGGEVRFFAFRPFSLLPQDETKGVQLIAPFLATDAYILITLRRHNKGRTKQVLGAAPVFPA